MWFRRGDKKEESGDSEKALREAENNLHRVQRRSEEVTELADAFREFRRRNHFAEQLEEIIGKRNRGSRHEPRY